MEIYEDIIEMVRDGDLDENIADIYNAVQMRRAILGGQERAKERPSRDNTAPLYKGEQVRFNSSVRPKYMEGAIATVVKNSPAGQKTVHVNLFDKRGRFEGTCRAYKSQLDVVE